MIKTVAIVSLSSGIIGENFVKHELDIGLRRLKEYGLNVKFMPNALKGIEYVKAHPEERAADLIAAFSDPEVDMILCATGGADTYRLLPYLFEHDELKNVIANKIFLGFSDTTINHLMLHKVGLTSYYGQAFLPDICELEDSMLPYSKQYFEELITTGGISVITPSAVWYEERESYREDQIGVPHVSHVDRGFELIQGSSEFSGEILGGCIDSLFDFFDGERYADMPILVEKYGLFPDKNDWNGRILLLESSEEQPSPEKYREALSFLKDKGVFEVVSGVLIGKPMNCRYEREYKEALIDVIDDPSLPILCNINIGHSLPRCIIPFGVKAHVDASAQKITFEYRT